MNLHSYLRVLRKRYKLVALAILACVAGAMVGSLLQTPRYETSVKLFVSVRTGSDINEIIQGGSFSQARVKSYANLVTSGPVLNAVYDKIGVSDLPASQRPTITAAPIEDTVIIRATVSDTLASRAKEAADALGSIFPNTINALEKPSNGGRAPVDIRVAEPAPLPGAPVTPRTKLNLALGLVVGLLLGGSLALLVDGLDTSIKSSDDLADLTDGTPVLGTIGVDEEADHILLISEDRQQSTTSESFRQLRSNVQFVDIDHDLRSIVVSSALPNEGKSTVSANLAVVMAQGGQRVILVEADLRRPTLSETLGVEGAAGLTNVLIGQVAVTDVLQPWHNGLFYFLPCGPIPPNPSELLGSQAMVDLVKQLESLADIVVFDSPPLLPVTDAAVLARATNGAIVVVRANRTTREQVRRALRSLHAVNANVIGLAMNFVKGEARNGYGYGYRGYATDHPTEPLVVPDLWANGLVPEPPPEQDDARVPPAGTVIPDIPYYAGAVAPQDELATRALQALQSSAPRRWRRVDAPPPDRT